MERSSATLKALHARKTYTQFSLVVGLRWSVIFHVCAILALALDYIFWARSQPIVLGGAVEIIMNDTLPSQKEALGRHQSKIPLPPKVIEKFKPAPTKPSDVSDPDAYRSKPAPKKPQEIPKEKRPPSPRPKTKPQPQGALKNLQDVTEKPTDKANVRHGSADGSESDDEIRTILMRQFNACWNKGTFMHAPNSRTFVVVVSLLMNQNGTVNKAEIISPKNTQNALYQVAVDEARNAVLDPRCQPIALPVQKYSRWKELEIVFDPKAMN
ncbi:MAG: hypothetical protein H6849_00960 [Alphaproteobacteria bacterium]|nr:MAG: hypothetical protein H6849_00960 [Alphaproteobacteria bacterium]